MPKKSRTSETDEFFSDQSTTAVSVDSPSVTSVRQARIGRRKPGAYKMLGVFAVVLVLGGVGIGVYKYYPHAVTASDDSSKPAVAGANKDQEKINAENKEIITEISKTMILPQEEPAVAVVKDAEKLAKEQPFFKDTANGDKVLIYSDRAIIYRPSTKQVVNSGPVEKDANKTAQTTDPSSQAAGQAATPAEKAEPLSVEVRNGSTKNGAAKALATDLEKNLGTKTLATVSAANSKYEETVIVNLTGKDVSALEKKFGVKAVTALPDGEKTSKADVVIVIGAK